MSDLKTFLKVLKKEGYPNDSVVTIAKMVDYDLEDFLPDLQQELGQEGVDDFAEKAINKLSTPDGIKVPWNYPDEYVYVKLHNIYFDEEEGNDFVMVSSEWGPSNILTTDEDGNESFETIETIINNADMGEWSNIDDLVDGIQESLSRKIYENCGFSIWFQ